jgi:hypothetical protein
MPARRLSCAGALIAPWQQRVCWCLESCSTQRSVHHGEPPPSRKGAHVPLLMAAHRADSFGNTSSRFWVLAPAGVHLCSGQMVLWFWNGCWRGSGYRLALAGSELIHQRLRQRLSRGL